MDQVQIDKIKDLIEYERNRTSPPSTFPKLPDLPGKRYTDREFFELEKENLWKTVDIQENNEWNVKL